MANDTSSTLRKLTSLRQRVRTVEDQAAEARVLFEQAKEAHDEAKKAARELGFDPDDTDAFAEWLDNEADEIEGTLRGIEEALGKLSEELR